MGPDQKDQRDQRERMIPEQEWFSEAKHGLAELLMSRVSAAPDQPCILEKVGESNWLTYTELKKRVMSFSAALIKNGFKQGDRLAILSENKWEWATSDFGAMCADGVVVPIYPTQTPDQIIYILNHCGAKVLVLSYQNQVDKILPHIDQLKDLEIIVGIDPGIKCELGRSYNGKPAPKYYEFKSFLALGADPEIQKEVQVRVQNQNPNAMCSIVYTSGTTGTPKGVILTHNGVTYAAYHGIHAFLGRKTPIANISSELDFLCFLPISHVYARMVYVGVLLSGGRIGFVESTDTIAKDLQAFRPSVFVAVPRLYEKFYEKIAQGAASGSPLKRNIFEWALGVGRARFHMGDQSSPLLKLKVKLAHRLVFRKIHHVLGGRVKLLVSGGARLAPEVCMFFNSVGLLIQEGYGLTETSGLLSVNRPKSNRVGTVGQSVRGITVKIAEDSEIIARGPCIMKGYYKDQHETDLAIDQEGWFHTGDLGFKDKEGFINITGRKKELIVMSNGKKVSPAPIEGLLLTSPLIEQVVLVGDSKKYISALVFPRIQPFTDKLAGKSFEGPEAQALIRTEIDRLTQGKLARFEEIKKFAIIKGELTVAGGELTPTLKIKRKLVEVKFKEQIEAMYLDHATHDNVN